MHCCSSTATLFLGGGNKGRRVFHLHPESQLHIKSGLETATWSAEATDAFVGQDSWLSCMRSIAVAITSQL